MTTEVKSWLAERKRHKCHRQLLVISGTQNWVEDSITQIFAANEPSTNICVGQIAGLNNIQSKQYRSVLGQEFEWVIYDGFAELRGNALLAMSGCVSQSGLMILLCPDLETWSTHTKTQSLVEGLNSDTSNQRSAFIDWLVEHIESFPEVSIWQQHHAKLTQVKEVNVNEQLFQDEACKTADQYQLVEYIKYVHGRNNNQIVVLADRGRGKSSALGIAAGQIAQSTTSRFIVTSAHRSMTQQIFNQAAKFIESKNDDFASSNQHVNPIQYLAFDKIIKSQPKGDWLFIDEAASIPTEVLEQLVTQYPNVILSTTIHGYEGSGRGFELRFKPFLKTHFANFREFVLHTPIRWFENDPLEAFWHQVMALKTTTENILSQQPTSQPPSVQGLPNQLLASTNNCKGLADSLSYQTYNGHQLISQPALLHGIFELLVDAHYQTTPDDLVRMLDANQQIHVIHDQHSDPICVALTALEGGEYLKPLAINIAQGNRRIPGHLIPQRLAFDHYEPKFMLDSHLRIVRIAVKQQFRHQHLGSTMLKLIKQDAIKNHIDFLGSSFGLTKALANFWFKNDFHLVKLGIKQDASSGEFSAIMLKPLTPQATESVKFLKEMCQQQINYQQDYRLQALSPSLITQLLNTLHVKSDKDVFNSQETKNYWLSLLKQFIAGNRPLYSVEFAIFHWLDSLNINAEKLAPHLRQTNDFINDVIVNKMSYEYISRAYKLTGKKQIESHLREQLRLLIEQYL
ncbi:MAG: GNAT family N-acetyltransferase [Aliiglaciecola sp.]|uniref:GNAT family N-acetyltransferase n=1 Tax=Aliiglaciecola sp. TaxID=1872441 RepID=UPI0032994F45